MSTTIAPNAARTIAQQFVSFLNKAVTPFHAVEECANMLREAGFAELREGDEWNVKPASKYYVTRNKSTICAFVVGAQYKAGNGFAIIGAHTDSPCLRVKPTSRLLSQGCHQVAVSTYGGGIWRTWFDRDLSIAGRIFIKGNNGAIRQQLIRVAKPILYMPNLCIHLETAVDRDRFEPNKEEHFRPIMATEYLEKQLNASVDKKDGTSCDHCSILMNVISTQANVPVENIVDMELYLYDTQPAAIGGIYEEFIAGARLDNLVSTYCSIRALIDSSKDVSNDTMIRIAACYDNEECGSESYAGAMSSGTEWLLRRLDGTQFERAAANSLMISADCAHAVHPNYAGKHEAAHRPQMHGGIVVKVNVNQRYATTGATYAVLRHIAEMAQVPLQKLTMRNDSPCGSTIGPILSSKLGIRTVDVGAPQLAMHSIREMCSITDIAYAIQLFTTFYKSCAQTLANVES